ncbi:hypothetical protein [Pleomorphovibrio marinus]|uniref:hypothetical protein n=1 Tax=Pleomorphovibrio marinus TaxID=2164132 RepID=UPI000E0A01B0|nr:hypothetical protein [Pleomorphovibrio marinus]
MLKQPRGGFVLVLQPSDCCHFIQPLFPFEQTMDEWITHFTHGLSSQLVVVVEQSTDNGIETMSSLL